MSTHERPDSITSHSIDIMHCLMSTSISIFPKGILCYDVVALATPGRSALDSDHIPLTSLAFQVEITVSPESKFPFSPNLLSPT